MIEFGLAIFCALSATKRGHHPAGGEIVFALFALSFLGDAVRSFIKWCRDTWRSA